MGEEMLELVVSMTVMSEITAWYLRVIFHNHESLDICTSVCAAAVSYCCNI